MKLYEPVKKQCPEITKTFLDYKRYKQLNLFIDLAHYNKTYLSNNNFILKKSIDMYLEFLRRFINDERITKAGYTKRTVFVPVWKSAWGVDDDTDIYDYLKVLNPLSVIYKKLRLSPTELDGLFDGIDFVFIGKNGFFKANIDTLTDNYTVNKGRFPTLIKKLINNEPIVDDEPDNSAEAIATEIIDKLESNKGIKIHNLTGEKADNQEVKDRMKADLVEKINDASKDAVDEDEALDKLDTDEVKELIEDLEEDADEGIKLSAARTSRMVKAQDNLMKKKVNGKTVKDMINEPNKVEELPETELPIKSINEDWKHLKAVNFEKTYDIDADIVSMLNSLTDTNKSYPISILDINVVDSSTTEDSIYTYTVSCEDYSGKRFTLKFDIPKFRDNRFLKLRGNEKVYSIEMPLIPISKTDEDTVQIATSYKKVFIRRYYTSSGKSTFATGKLMKALSKYEGKNIKIILGDNAKICKKYELPIDYVDLANTYNKIEFKTLDGANIVFYFNQDEIRKVAKVDEAKGIPIGLSNNKEVIYYNSSAFGTVSELIISYLFGADKDFAKLYSDTNIGKKCTYSRCTVMATDIPTIVVLSHGMGLTKAMDLAGIKYDLTEKRPSGNKNTSHDTIKFMDGYLTYQVDYSSAMLMNGLKDCNTEDFSIKQINTKNMWVEMLDNFGGRIKSDGLDNFKDLEFDPITVQVCRDYKLPDNYFEALIYANNLLVDNKYVRQTDLSSNRYRTNEVVAVHFYQEMARAYGEYATMHRRGANSAMFIRQSAIIDSILASNTTSDLSIFQPLSEVEAKNLISFKGAVGMNTERAFTTDKRGYDDSMVNIIAQATGFASTVGINRQTTINPNITGGRGYFKNSGEDDMSVANTMSITEALSPFTLTSDDAFRNAMTFVQTSKHTTPIEKGSPLLVTTGADAAMPYLTSDMFCHKAKKKGTVKEIVEGKYLLVEYEDKTTEYVTLEERTMKNSDGGFYIPLKLVTDLKVGSKVKENTILAYDKKSFSTKVGDGSQLAYNLGCIANIAIMTTEDGYEDSAIGSEWLSEAMGTDIVVMKDIDLPPSTEILKMPKKGDKIVEGEPMLIFQNAYDEEDANALLKALNDDEDAVSEIGRNTINAKVTGVIQDIKIYRTVEVDELSESLKKIVTSKEREITRYSNIAKKASNDTSSLFDPAKKVENNGKLKNTDGVRIEIYMKYHDTLAVGDKVVANSANKMVLMNVYKDKDAPYTERRPNEAIDLVGSASAIDGRMITSNFKLGALYKLMIETHRYCCDKLGIKWKTLHEIYDEK
jgi:hypothetical protein